MPFSRPHDCFHWTSPKVAVRPHPVLEHSLTAIARIARDELVMVTGGHIMTIDEHNALPGELQHFATHVTEHHLIGRIRLEDEEQGEFINHSCNPTCGMDGPLNIVAMRALVPGDAITLDYAMCMSSDILDFACECGEKDCRGHISGHDWKLAALQQRYRGYFVTYIQRWIDRSSTCASHPRNTGDR